MSAIARHPFELEGAAGATLRAVLHLSDPPAGDGAGAALPVVVVCHGFKGFKDWGMFPWLADTLAAAGFAVVRMDFSHNGVETDTDTFERLDLFEQDRISYTLADLAAVTAALRAGRVPEAARCDASRLGIVGHSRGGGSVVLYASEDAGVQAVAGLAPVSSFLRFPPSKVTEWRRDGVLHIPNGRTGQQMPMGLAFLEELDGDPERFALENACKKLQRPLLVIHGEQDEAVPFFEGEALVNWAGDHGRYHQIAGAGHTFGCVHPFAGPTPQIEEAARELAAFFGEHLAR